MKRFKSNVLFVASLALFALAVSATAAHADPPTDAGGTLQYETPTLLDLTEVGQTVFIEAEADGVIGDGTFIGSIHEEYTVVHHVKTEFNTYRGVLHFEGVVIDSEGVQREGTLTLHTRGRQDPGMVFPTDTPWHMSWVIVEGDGELEHVQGHGTGVLVGLELIYTGRVHFAGH
ncbi:MAG: hypothetical protein OEU32_08070 [Acidimicrobiia bacterium]|nr:hypothetical protein [Acidimicrobiia bacterium]